MTASPSLAGMAASLIAKRPDPPGNLRHTSADLMWHVGASPRQFAIKHE